MLERFRPSPNERGLTFGITWSAVGCALAVIGLTSCGYILPEDNRPPRYNTVIGERRTPPMNHAVGANMPDPQTGEYAGPAAPPMSAGAPSASSGQAPIPTASVNTPNGQAPAIKGNQGPQRSFWDKSKGWIFGEDADIQKTPIPLGAPLPPGALKDTDTDEAGDSVEIAMGASSDYPKLQDVKNVPEASLEAKDKLQQAQEALRIDKERATAERDALAQEAVSEPTLLEQYKQGKLPPAPQAQPLAPQAQPLAPRAQNAVPEVNLPGSAPQVAAPAPAPQPVPQAAAPTPDMAPAMPYGELEPLLPVEAETVELPPPPPTVNVVRGVQSETVEIREPVTDSSGAGYLPASRYEMRTEATN